MNDIEAYEGLRLYCTAVTSLALELETMVTSLALELETDLRPCYLYDLWVNFFNFVINSPGILTMS